MNHLEIIYYDLDIDREIFHLMTLSCSLVPVTEASVVIAVSSPHRKDSIDATEFFIDSLKASVPIWKKVYNIYNHHVIMICCMAS